MAFHAEYERDAGTFARPQGYGIRLNMLGIEALKALLPEKVWERVYMTCAIHIPVMRVFDLFAGQQLGGAMGLKNSKIAEGHAPPDGVDLDNRIVKLAMTSRLVADRALLREALLGGIEDLVTFSSEFVDFIISP